MAIRKVNDPNKPGGASGANSGAAPRAAGRPGGVSSSPSASNLSGGAPAPPAGGAGAAPRPHTLAKTTGVPGIAYTTEEKNSVDTLLAELSQPRLSPEEGDKLWRQHLDRIGSLTEKVLAHAATHYDPPAPPEPSSSGKGGAAGANKEGGGPHGKRSSIVGGSDNNSSASNNNPFFSGAQNNSGLWEVALEEEHRTVAECQADFVKDNQYLVAQLKQFQWCPFTALRLLELLQDPLQYHVAGHNISHGNSKTKKGGLRGPKLQEALRRCVLVTNPFYTTSTTGESL